MFTIKVNAQTISNVRISPNTTHLCPATAYTVLFDTAGTSGSTFEVQLSSSTGIFSAPTATNTGTSNSLTINVPSGATLSNTYAIRVIRTIPSIIISSDTLKNLSVTRPTSAFTFTNNNTCAGTNIVFTNGSTGVAPLSYNWTFGAISSGAPASSSAQNPSVSFNPVVGGGSVSYSTTLITTDGYGCVGSTTNSIIVKQLPDPSLINFTSTPFINCSGLTFFITIDNTASTTSTNTNYNINYVNGVIRNFGSSFITDTLTYSSFGYFNLKNTVTNTNGCNKDTTYSVFNGYFPPGSIVNPGLGIGCIPFSFNIPFDSLVNLNPIGTYYTLSFSDGRPDTSFYHPPPAFIPHTINKGSCGFTGSNGLTMFPNSFQVNCVVTNPCGTNGSVIVPIRTKSKPTALFNLNNNTICFGTNITATDVSIKGKYLSGNPIGTTCDSIATRRWFISGPSYAIISGTLGTTFSPSGQGSQTLVIQPNSTGIYTIKLIIRNLSGCGDDSITKTICVQPIPIPNFSLLQNPSNGCKNNTVSITNTSNTLLSCSTPVYTWTIKDSTTSAVLTPGARFTYTSGTNANSANPVLLFSQKGRYVIRLTISNTCPGNYFKDTLIIIKDIPVVGLPPDIIYCDSQTINYGATYDSSFSAITQYNWSISQTPGPQTGFSFVSGSNTSRNPRIRFTNFTTAPISYRIILTATNECGISLPDTQNIIINPKPIVTATSSVDSFCSGGTTSITLSNNLVGGAYYWRAIPS
ncbi:MAG: hypothetical protein FGM41_02445, partial [Bacteroidetes bacterium]|nr:hypothetical protein [Bacteroidota bacterium]